MITLRFADGSMKNVGSFILEYTDLERAYFLRQMDDASTTETRSFLTAAKREFGAAIQGYPERNCVEVRRDQKAVIYRFLPRQNRFVFRS